MARKRKDKSSNPAKNGQSAATPSKKQAVREALANGITSPTEIASHLKSAYGLDITTNYVSVIKGELGVTKKHKRKPGRKPKVKQVAVTEITVEPASAPKANGLTLEDLRSLAELARRVGGFTQLREFIDVLDDVS